MNSTSGIIISRIYNAGKCSIPPCILSLPLSLFTPLSPFFSLSISALLPSVFLPLSLPALLSLLTIPFIPASVRPSAFTYFFLSQHLSLTFILSLPLFVPTSLLYPSLFSSVYLWVYFIPSLYPFL